MAGKKGLIGRKIGMTYFFPRRLVEPGDLKAGSGGEQIKSLVGWFLAEDVVDAKSGKIIAGRGTLITEAVANKILQADLSEPIAVMSGEGVAATVLEAGPCIVVQHRTKERDGYEALQLGFGKVKPQRVKKPQVGHFKRAGLKPEQYCRHLREIRDASPETAAVGEELKVDIFQVGERVNVRGTTKGRGFAGVMKRWGFHGHKASHGAKIHRTPASAGATDAARVFPGKKSPGHMGNARHTVRNLEVLMVDPEHNLLVVKGAVPGPRGGLVVITAEA